MSPAGASDMPSVYRAEALAKAGLALLMRHGSIVRIDSHQVCMRLDVRLDDCLSLGHRVRLAGAENGVGLDERLLAGRCGLGTVVNRGNGAGRNAGPAVDALLRMDIEHRRGFELRLVLARVDAVDRAHVYAGVVLGADARICDYERHYVELTQKWRSGETPSLETL